MAKAKKSGGCTIVKFKGKKEPVSFCKKEASPAQKSAKKARAKRILKAHACKSPAISKFPALKKACRKLAA